MTTATGTPPLRTSHAPLHPRAAAASPARFALRLHARAATAAARLAPGPDSRAAAPPACRALRLHPRAAAVIVPPARRALTFLLLAAIAALAALTTTAPAAAAHYTQGEHLSFVGVVADAQGRPLADVRVVLEVSRAYFNLRELRRGEKDTRRISAASDAKGEYAIDWQWDGYYNHFKLAAGVPVRKGKEETLHVLDEVDVTDRVQAGTPIVSTLEVKDRAYLDRFRDFMASIKSADERQVYNDMGAPDDVKRINYAGGTSAVEVSWWYFSAGKVYRFRDGRLEQVSDFEPVKGF
jgi:hypothetical protein